MLRKICDILSALLMLLLAVLAVILIAPQLLGCKTLAVLSGSMEPEIPVGSVVIVKKEEPSALQIGDIATYRMNDNTMVTHRVLENHTEEQYLIFKGDANDVPDANPISYSDVEGSVFLHFPWIGYISIYIKTPLGIAAVCGVVFVMVLLVFLPSIFEPENEKKEINE